MDLHGHPRPIQRGSMGRWGSVALFGLYLLSAMPAEAQRRGLRERRVDAVEEASRGDPLRERTAREATQRAVGLLPADASTAHVAAAVRGQLKLKKLMPRLEREGNQQVFGLRLLEATDLRPGNLRGQRRLGVDPDRAKQVEAIERLLIRIDKRDQVLEDMGATEVTTLEPRRLHSQAQSEVESYLEQRNVPNYKEVANSFDVNATVKVVTLPKDVSLLRIVGGTSRPTGRYLFCCLESPIDAPKWVRLSTDQFAGWTDAKGLALPPGNLADDLALITVPAGTRVVVGTVADNFQDVAGQYRLGGNTQIYLPERVDFPHRKYQVNGHEADPSDIVVLFEGDKLLRFRPGPAQD
jgi:hypothetical protein